MDYIDYGIMDGHTKVGIIEVVSPLINPWDAPRYKVQILGFEGVEGSICTPWKSSVEIVDGDT